MTTPSVQARDFSKQYWIESSSPALEGRLATVFALANGHLGVRGTLEEMPGWASPGFYVAGTFSKAPQSLIPIHSPDHILTHPERVKPEHHAEWEAMGMTTMPNLPNPVAVKLAIGGVAVELEAVSILACERILHMEEARVTRRLVIRDTGGHRVVIDSERFASWNNGKLLCFRYEVTPDDEVAVEVAPYIDTTVSNARNTRLFTVEEEKAEAGLNAVTVSIPQPNRVAIAQAYTVRQEGRTTVLEVFASAEAGELAVPERIAHAAQAAGYAACREAHLAAVRFAAMRGGVDLHAGVLAEQGFRFGQLHLEMAFPYDRPDLGVPIKGLTGEGYRFMVFWDMDFHMFHYYLLTNPTQAKNHIRYRYNLLDAARANAKAWGYQGAQVPWETGTTGEEETAPWLNLQDGELHISADAAYCVKLYDDLTGDSSVLIDYGAELVFETARFYASRVTWNAEANRYEMCDIGCPDQYHTFADNNIFISRMAQWNLAYAAELAGDPRLHEVRAKIGLADVEVAQFCSIATQFYIIEPNEEGIIEEFPGFFERSTDLRGISEMFCEHTQAVKQPDVLAIFLPFEKDYSEEIQRKNWFFYEARTLHGSSLSLPGMALAAAKCGLLDQAVDYFQRAARMDLDDVNLNTALGVHLAGYGVMWETLVYGFGGLTPSRDGLHFTPRLPLQWGRLSYGIYWHGAHVRVDLNHGQLVLSADAFNPCAVPVWVQGEPHTLTPGDARAFQVM